MHDLYLRARRAEIQASKERPVDFLSVVDPVVHDVVRRPRSPDRIFNSEGGLPCSP